MKKTPTALILPFFLALFCAAGLSSCMVYSDAYYTDGPGYGGPYYGGGGGYVYDDWGASYYDYYPPVYRSYISYSAAWPYYYGGRYYSHRWWDDNRYRHYRYDHGSNRHRYSKRRSGEEMKLVRYRGPERGRLPSGYHSEQWYRDRGYDLRSNTYRERDGDLRGRRPSSSSSSSSNRKKASDPRPSSEHPRAIRQPDRYQYVGPAGRDDNRRTPSSSRASSSSNDARRVSSGSYDNRAAMARRNPSESRGSRPSPSSRGARDDRPTSDHPRALRQPDSYRHSGGGGDKRGSKDKKD